MRCQKNKSQEAIVNIGNECCITLAECNKLQSIGIPWGINVWGRVPFQEMRECNVR